jgi:hypothetical protein
MKSEDQSAYVDETKKKHKDNLNFSLFRLLTRFTAYRSHFKLPSKLTLTAYETKARPSEKLRTFVSHILTSICCSVVNDRVLRAPGTLIDGRVNDSIQNRLSQGIGLYSQHP